MSDGLFMEGAGGSGQGVRYRRRENGENGGPGLID